MSLSVRLVLTLLVPIALCFAGYGYVNVRLRRAELRQEAEHEVRDHSVAIAVAVDAFIRDHNLEELDDLTQGLARANRLLGVVVFDASDVPVDVSRPLRVYRSSVERLARTARTSGRPAAAEFEADGHVLYAYAFPIGFQPDEGIPARGSAVVIRDLRYIDELLASSTSREALAAAAVALAVIAGTFLSLRGAVLRPLRQLLAGFDRVGDGELDARVAPVRDDEMGRLAEEFNRTVDKLRAARNELETRREATLALERRLHHAQRLALVGQVAASVAHQIGSPLNVILGRARYALQQGGQSDRDRRHFEQILTGAESISSVIERLLSQARRVRGEPGPVDVGKVAWETLVFLEAECDRKGIRSTLHAEDNLVVRGTRAEIEQLVLNLCMNAMQAQPNGGRLAVTARRKRESRGAPSAELLVSDAGPGVPAELREKIFEAFFTTKKGGEGTGLGLAICEEIVRRQGGTLTVEEAPSGGAPFRVTLPMKDAEAAVEDASVARPRQPTPPPRVVADPSVHKKNTPIAATASPSFTSTNVGSGSKADVATPPDPVSSESAMAPESK